VPAPDLDSAWRERSVGGLGWHLVRRVIDEVGWAPAVPCGNAYRLVKHFAAHATDLPATRERSTPT
jgi:anti-sigma regulatory factor (Ser/Thr protein kinase)